MTCDLSCILTGHREGRLAQASLRAFDAACDAALASGLTLERLFILDRPDSLTRQVFETFRRPGDQIRIVDHGDQGLARNDAVSLARGRWSAFLDGDDLWSADWLVAATRFLTPLPATHIAHPEFNYFFEGQATIFRHIDQEDPAFRPALLRMANYWDALSVCPTEIHREFPFEKRDIAGGWAYEDWRWNCDTLAAGKVHKVVPDSVLFKRRKARSQTLEATENRSLIRLNALSRYGVCADMTTPET